MSRWTGALPGVPVTVAMPPSTGVSVGPGPASAVVVPADWMHIVPDFKAARFSTAGSLGAVTGAGTVAGFEGDVVLGALVMSWQELAAGFTAAVTASGQVRVPVDASVATVGALSADASAGASANYMAAGDLAVSVRAEGTNTAPFDTTGVLAALVESVGYAAAFTATGSLTAKVSQGDRAGADFEAEGTLNAAVLVLFVRDATYQAAVTLAAAQAVAPDDGKSAGASLAAQSMAVALQAPHITFGATLAATIEWELSGITYADDFNRPNGDLGAPWIRRVAYGSDNYKIQSNQLQRSGGGTNRRYDTQDAYIYGLPTNGDNQFAEVAVPTMDNRAGNGPGVVLGSNETGTAPALHAAVQGNFWELYIATPGVDNDPALIVLAESGSLPNGTFISGGIVRLEKSGNTAKLWYGPELLVEHTRAEGLPSGKYVGIKAGSAYYRTDDWEGGDLIQLASSVQAMGAYCTGDTSSFGNNTWRDIKNWTGMSAYPGTVVDSTNGKITVAGDGLAEVSAKVTRGASDTTFEARLMVNGFRAAISGKGGEVFTLSWQGTVAEGDEIWIEVYTGAALVGARPVLGGETVTYITINPA